MLARLLDVSAMFLYLQYQRYIPVARTTLSHVTGHRDYTLRQAALTQEWYATPIHPPDHRNEEKTVRLSHADLDTSGQHARY